MNITATLTRPPPTPASGGHAKHIMYHISPGLPGMPSDPESRHFDMVWIPAFAGMTIIGLFTRASRFDAHHFVQALIKKFSRSNCGAVAEDFMARSIPKR